LLILTQNIWKKIINWEKIEAIIIKKSAARLECHAAEKNGLHIVNV